MELKRIKHDVLYEGRVFDLIVDHVQYPSGNTSVREIAHHPGGAVAVPVLDDGRIILVRQLRYPLGEYILELPAGKLGRGEDPEAAAGRELEEETGWTSGTLEKLTTMHTSPGFSDEVLHVFLATDLRKSPLGHKREEGESSMTVHILTLEEALHMVESGEISDGKTIVGLLLTDRRLARRP
jgi:ADP-ribose pyrophosphatase